MTRVKRRVSVGADERGQVYTLEAIIAAVIIGTVLMFVIPAFVISPGADELGTIENETAVEQDAEELLQSHIDSGYVQTAVLDYNDVEGQWQSGPTGFDDENLVTQPDGPFGDSVADLQDRHGVIVDIYLTPSPEDGDSERILYSDGGDSDDIITTVSGTITLYENQRLESPPEAHSRTGSAYAQNEGDGERLENTDEFPIDNRDTDGSVYNTVEVELVIMAEN